MTEPTADALCPTLHRFDGPGGLPMIDIRNAHATARVSLYGAQVLAFQPRGERELLFLSERAAYQPGKAIRGGVPVCWPWFGPDPQGLGRPAHGLARTRQWQLRGSGILPDGQTRLTLGLRDDDQTRALWPHAFDLSLDITVGRTLHLALCTRNTGSTPMTLTQALHSYFAVADIHQTRVEGLDGCTYTDKARVAGGAQRLQAGPVHFSGEVDRVYARVPADLRIDDGAGQRTVRVRAEGSQTAVVWNPGPDISAGMADLDDDAWRRFVCVETANAGEEVIHLAPGAQHTLLAEIGPG